MNSHSEVGGGNTTDGTELHHQGDQNNLLFKPFSTVFITSEAFSAAPCTRRPSIHPPGTGTPTPPPNPPHHHPHRATVDGCHCHDHLWSLNANMLPQLASFN